MMGSAMARMRAWVKAFSSWPWLETAFMVCPIWLEIEGKRCRVPIALEFAGHRLNCPNILKACRPMEPATGHSLSTNRRVYGDDADRQFKPGPTTGINQPAQ